MRKKPLGIVVSVSTRIENAAAARLFLNLPVPARTPASWFPPLPFTIEAAASPLHPSYPIEKPFDPTRINPGAVSCRFLKSA